MRNEGRRSVGVDLSRRNGLGDWTRQGEMRPQLPQGLKSMRASFINAQANLEDAKNVPQWLELNYCGRASEVQRLSRRVGDEELDVACLAAGHPGIQGQAWGFDNRGIWVDRGCPADFLTMRR